MTGTRYISGDWAWTWGKKPSHAFVEMYTLAVKMVISAVREASHGLQQEERGSRSKRIRRNKKKKLQLI